MTFDMTSDGTITVPSYVQLLDTATVLQNAARACRACDDTFSAFINTEVYTDTGIIEGIKLTSMTFKNKNACCSDTKVSVLLCNCVLKYLLAHILTSVT
jgi:hypothetical protein